MKLCPERLVAGALVMRDAELVETVVHQDRRQRIEECFVDVQPEFLEEPLKKNRRAEIRVIHEMTEFVRLRGLVDKYVVHLDRCEAVGFAELFGQDVREELVGVVKMHSVIELRKLFFCFFVYFHIRIECMISKEWSVLSLISFHLEIRADLLKRELERVADVVE